MKNNRFLKIMICIAVSVFLLVMFKFNSSAAYSMFGSDKDEFQMISSEYETMCDNIKKKNYYENSVLDLNSKINDLNVMTNLRQEKIIDILDEHLSNCSIDASGISFSEVKSINDYDGEATDEAAEFEAEEISVELNFKSSYANILKFIDEIQNSNSNVVIRNVRISLSGENDSVYGTVVLGFYALPMDASYE